MTDNCMFNTFETAFQNNQSCLVWDSIPADLNTPVTAYLKLTQSRPYSFLYESIEGGENVGRYSIIGCDPAQDRIYKNVSPNDIRDALKTCAIDTIPDHLPPMAVSGLFGYIGYDFVRYIEDIPDTNPDPLGTDDSILYAPSLLCIFDHVKNMIFLISPHYASDFDDAQTAWSAHQSRLNQAKHALYGTINPALLAYKTAYETLPDIHYHTQKSDFVANVNAVKNYITEGDVFQTVLSQRFSCDCDLPAFALYRTLRMENPSPFMFFMTFDDDTHIVGASPEILVRVRDETVTVRPIAGTRPRGNTPDQDNAFAADLLADEKENAEHLMLLDLGRNDVGKVAKFGTVNVTARNQIERYSHVMHIISNVEGQLADDKDAIDAFMAGFPAGTVSGAPKIRAMEIIDELEPVKRGIYAGAVGYFGANGNIDTCIALRTGIVKNGTLTAQAGAGIVADSDPEAEFQECINKSRALFAAASKAIRLTNQENRGKNHPPR